MADDKKKPAGADIDDLKARLGLKKGEAGGAQPGAPGSPPGVGGPPGMGAPPGIGPGGAAPPPAFMQQQRQVDVTKDPFAPSVGTEVKRPSLIGESRPSQMTVSVSNA